MRDSGSPDHRREPDFGAKMTQLRGLSIRRPGRQLVEFLKWLIVILVFAATVLIIYSLMVAQWRSLVRDTESFAAWTCVAFISIFLCSCAEIAISETKEVHINDWINALTHKYQRDKTWLQQAFERYAGFVTEHANIFNPIIILANMTILIIYTSIVVPSLILPLAAIAVVHVPVAGLDVSLPLSQSEAFTGIGLTVALFLAAELVPKQIALRWRMGSLIYTAWWVIALTVCFAIPAYGMAKPVIKLLNIGNKRPARD